jgi:hypothetical protein
VPGDRKAKSISADKPSASTAPALRRTKKSPTTAGSAGASSSGKSKSRKTGRLITAAEALDNTLGLLAAKHARDQAPAVWQEHDSRRPSRPSPGNAHGSLDGGGQLHVGESAGTGKDAEVANRPLRQPADKSKSR